MRKITIPFFLLLVCSLTSCQKFLEEKRVKSMVVPATLADCQALLDYYLFMNNKEAIAGEVSAGDFYVTDATYASLSPDYYRRMYTWEREDVFPVNHDWELLYQTVYYANTVLETLGKIPVTERNRPEWNDIRGQALVFRAKSFLQALWQWSVAYDKTTANSDLGIPLRLTTNFNTTSVRSSVQDSYDQLIADLKEAGKLLPPQNKYPTRPSKNTVFAYLARAYLSMRAYEQAGAYADSALMIKSDLLDYNTMNPAAAFPFSPLNEEVIFTARAGNLSILLQTNAKIDSLLFKSYDQNDLRKTLFFKKNTDGSYSFKGSYEGGQPLFAGITTAELFLARAESHARKGNTTEALKDINHLLTNRYKAGSFRPISETDRAALTDLIVKERRKELVLRFLRWMDIKRLNREGADINLVRVINGNEYKLPANSKHFALPIPDHVISLSGIQQNP